MHKQTLCGQTTGGLGCGERRGGREQERKVRGRGKWEECVFTGRETVIPSEGAAAVF